TRLRAYLTQLFREYDRATRVGEFLGELVGARSPERPGVELRAARNDPQIKGAWLRRSFIEWTLAECAAMPLLFVVEDLHWGDLPAVRCLGEALCGLLAEPLMVLALARPEVHESFPGLWSGCERIDVPLGRLAPRAAERLVREALGGGVAPEAVARIIDRADGN